MDRFSRIGVFVKVVEHGSFSRAAEELKITKSAVSKHVQALEDSLAVRLLNRTTRKIALTEAGKEFYERTASIVENLDEAENLVRNMSHTPTGKLRICAPLAFGTIHLTPAIADFVIQYPDINVELDLDCPVSSAMNEGFDLVIHTGKLIDSSMIARKICDCDMVLIASPKYLKKYGTPKNIDELSQQHKHIEYSKRSPVRGEWEYSSVKNNTDSGTFRINEVFAASNGQALLAAAIKGIGITCLPTYVCADELRSGALKSIMPEYKFNSGFNSDLAVYAIFPHRNNLSVKVRLFIEHLVKHFSSGQW